MSHKSFEQGLKHIPPEVCADIETYWVKIYIGGDISQIKQVCRDWCMKIGACVTITEYIFSGGSELGAEIGFINYGRFPCKPDVIDAKAFDLTLTLIEACCQWSASIVTPNKTLWLSRREDDVKEHD